MAEPGLNDASPRTAIREYGEKKSLRARRKDGWAKGEGGGLRNIYKILFIYFFKMWNVLKF